MLLLMTHTHCYLFALEVVPMQVGDVYDELPLHCTLMHRFWLDLSPEDFTHQITSLFKQIAPIKLIAHEHLLLGPKQLPVSELTLTDELRQLHMEIYTFLNKIGVEYTAPEWVGKGYRAHITERDSVRLEVGAEHISKAVYLIEVNVPGHEHKRIIRAKFDLGANT
jgi:hypothetical protein